MVTANCYLLQTHTKYSMFKVDTSKIHLDVPCKKTMKDWSLKEEVYTLPKNLIVKWYPHYCVLHTVNVVPTPDVSDEIQDFFLDKLTDDYVLSEEVGRILLEARVITLVSKVNVMDIYENLVISDFWNTIGRIRIGLDYNLSSAERWYIKKLDTIKYRGVITKIPIVKLIDISSSELEVAYRSTWIALGRDCVSGDFNDKLISILTSEMLWRYSNILDRIEEYYSENYSDEELDSIKGWFTNYGIYPTLDLSIIAHDNRQEMLDLVSEIKSI